MRKLLSPLLSLFTAVGGHLLNHRPDLVLLFFVLLLLAITLPMYVVPMYLFNTADTDYASLKNLSGTISQILSVSLGILLVASAVVSLLKADAATTLPRISVSGKVGGLLATFISLVMIAWTVSAYNLLHNIRLNNGTIASVSDESDGSAITFRHSNHFHHYVRYSNEWVDEAGLAPLPNGDSYLTGRITYQGEPAKGVSLFAIVNSRYRSQAVTTGNDGYFHITVANGKWTVNRIELTGWKQRPDTGDLTITAGIDPTLSKSMYRSGPNFNSPGLTLQATEAQTFQSDLTLAMHDIPVITNPAKLKQKSDPNSDIIKWEPVNGASHYQLQLHETKRDGNSTSYYPTVWFNTDNTNVALSQFKSVDNGDSVDNEYTVKIFAFDGQGKLLSSNDFSRNSSIILNGRKFVSEREIRTLGDTTDMSGEEFMQLLEATQRDRRRIEAAQTLIKDNMTDAALSLLEKVETEKLDKEKSVALGMAMAATGKCEEAHNLFTELDMQHDRSCKPDFVKQLCPE